MFYVMEQVYSNVINQLAQYMIQLQYNKCNISSIHPAAIFPFAFITIQFVMQYKLI